MELIFLFTKFIEYTVVAPLWWAATWLAALFFPLEGDWRQDMLGVLFSALIVAGLYFGYTTLSAQPAPTAAEAAPAQASAPQPQQPDMDELKAQMETLKAIKSMNASIPAEAGR